MEPAWAPGDPVSKKKNVAGKSTEWVEGFSWAHEDQGSKWHVAGLVVQVPFLGAGGALGSPGQPSLTAALQTQNEMEGAKGTAQWLQHRLLPQRTQVRLPAYIAAHTGLGLQLQGT